MSFFSDTLAGLLDHVFTTEEWAAILHATPETVENWKIDGEYPEPWQLDLIYQIVEDDDTADEALTAFEVMSQRPAEEVSPYGELMGPVVWEYMTRYKLDDDLSSRLNTYTRNKVTISDWITSIGKKIKTNFTFGTSRRRIRM